MAVISLIIFACFFSQQATSDKIYTVVANQSASSCPSHHTGCSLMYYAAHQDEYFTEDNIAFRFLPGEHKLVNSTLVLMANISNLTLYGIEAGNTEVIGVYVAENVPVGSHSIMLQT